jgi:hypothetical protein
VGAGPAVVVYSGVWFNTPRRLIPSAGSISKSPPFGGRVGYNGEFGYAFGTKALSKAYMDIGWFLGLGEIGKMESFMIPQHFGLGYKFYIPSTSLAVGASAGYMFDWVGLLTSHTRDALYLKLSFIPYVNQHKELSLYFEYFSRLNSSGGVAFPTWALGLGYAL